MKNFNISLTITLFIIIFFTTCKNDDLFDIPVVDFKYSPTKVKVQEEVMFTSTSKHIDGWTWDFGDGSGYSYENPTHHIYEQPGTFSVQLTGKNYKNGITKTITKEITVSGEPSPPNLIMEHNDNITEDETWSNKYIHIINYTIAVEGATLTIEPGTIIKFNANTSLILKELNNGKSAKLIAKGTADKHITFTANSENPQQGDWQQIYFGSGASHESIMEYCDISYGGKRQNEYPSEENINGSLELHKTNIIFNHNTITHSGDYGIHCIDDGFFSSFNHNIIADNANSAMIIKAKYVHTLGEGNEIDNTKYGIEIKGDLDLSGDFLWRNHGTKYTCTSPVNIGSDAGTSLTIEKGVSIAFTSKGGIRIGENKKGKLTAIGTITEPIHFESDKIDIPKSYNHSIYFGKFNDPTSKMEYCEIDYGGSSSNHGAVHLLNTKISFDNCTITNSKSHSVILWGNASFNSFTGNTIQHSKESSIKIPAQWAHTIGANNNIANDKFGIEVSGKFNHQNKSFTWLKQTCPYTLVGNVTIGSVQGCTLTIEPGTTIQLAEKVKLTIGHENNSAGALIAKGTPDNKITFSSVAAPNFWAYIWFGKGTMSESILEYCTISNGGNYSSSYGAVHCGNTNLNNTPIIKNCHIANSKSHGISINNASPVLENNTFENISGEDVYNGN